MFRKRDTANAIIAAAALNERAVLVANDRGMTERAEREGIVVWTRGRFVDAVEAMDNPYG